LYVSSEEFPSYTLKNKLTLVGGAAYGWEFSKTLNALRADHKFLVIDSTNHYKFTMADLKALKARRPDLAIILIVQITKGGTFKGDQSLEHEVDTVIKVTADGAATIKNRFQELTSVPVFE
jgi:predicted ATP-dependent serine protease